MTVVTNSYKTTPNCTRGMPCRLCRARITFLQRNPRALAISQTSPYPRQKTPWSSAPMQTPSKTFPFFRPSCPPHLYYCEATPPSASSAATQGAMEPRHREPGEFPPEYGKDLHPALPLFLCFPCSCTGALGFFRPIMAM